VEHAFVSGHGRVPIQAVSGTKQGGVNNGGKERGTSHGVPRSDSGERPASVVLMVRSRVKPGVSNHGDGHGRAAILRDGASRLLRMRPERVAIARCRGSHPVYSRMCMPAPQRSIR
jgi:hypothetical protein